MMLFLFFNLSVNTYDFAYYKRNWEQGISITGPGYEYIFILASNAVILYDFMALILKQDSSSSYVFIIDFQFFIHFYLKMGINCYTFQSVF